MLDIGETQNEMANQITYLIYLFSCENFVRGKFREIKRYFNITRLPRNLGH